MELLPGDILLWKVDSRASLIDRAIGWAERRKGRQKGPAAYYHVAFVAQDIKKMYSSQPPKIDLYPVPDPLPFYIEVYRLMAKATPDGMVKVYEYAESRRGRWYDFLGCGTAGFLELGGLEFCSQYTENAYERYPLCLNEKEQFTTPDDIAACPLLTRIG